ncbi:MAG: c-type cytochrome [Halioglobus sp.]|nr:c-type cytochrome [Halioglobus sp.]
MEHNSFQKDGIHACVGECYTEWQASTGGVVGVMKAKAQAQAEASPEELGKAAYTGCIACHGANGEGGIGPALAGQSSAEIYDKLVQYKNGDTRGAQSALMWSQAEALSDDDMKHIAAFVAALKQ